MNDYILRVTAANGTIRAFFADTRETVNEAAKIHNTTAVVSAALGRLLTAGAIMGLMLKNESDLLTLNIKGDGPVGGLMVTADNKARVKGYAYNPQADAESKPDGKLNVSGIVGKGSLNVIKDMGMKDAYIGQVELLSGEIAEDIAYYFVQSEQTPSVVSLGVLVDRDYTIKQSGGFILQLMPDAPDEIIDKLEEKINALPSITALLDSGKTPELIADMLFADFGYEILEKSPTEFYCNCSRERVEAALTAVGKAELEKIINDDGQTTLNCHFCNSDYHFEKAELFNIINNI